ncbi:Fe-S cluster assembly protein SufB [bacterium]|nr:Fe-S cluster assembly protein SufB [bacterium]MCI0566364.1 Fe-S cluster assembly protein SufB [bacterium]MCI0680125.1 Fe-S cluster assembly protein SufB [bacterium]
MSTVSNPTESLVRQMSEEKKEPEWMLDKRLAALKLYHGTPMPSWGPDLGGLDLENMLYYVPPGAAQTDSWKELPAEITSTFEKLGIPKAERDFLGGVGAQYDSGVVYHRIKKSLSDKGVIFENMDTALAKYPDLVEKHFMTKCVPATDHKFTMLHGAVWSGGTFIYVPKGVKVDLPLQAYFRMNRERSAQFEHTLIIADEGSEISYIEGCSAPQYNASSLHCGCVELWVMKDARIQYTSIENWSRNTYNLNTKKALVFEDASIQWLNGNMGSRVTMLYPSSVLLGRRAHSESLGVVFAGKGQVQDTGSKAIHIAPETTSIIRSKSLSKDGGTSNYRGYVKIFPSAENAKASVTCDALILDKESASNTYPSMKNMNAKVNIAHEARVGRIGEEEVFYLMNRGFSEEETLRLIVGGFVGDVVRELPLEYALELNKLIELEMEGSVG